MKKPKSRWLYSIDTTVLIDEAQAGTQQYVSQQTYHDMIANFEVLKKIKTWWTLVYVEFEGGCHVRVTRWPHAASAKISGIHEFLFKLFDDRYDRKTAGPYVTDFDVSYFTSRVIAEPLRNVGAKN